MHQVIIVTTAQSGGKGVPPEGLKKRGSEPGGASIGSQFGTTPLSKAVFSINHQPTFGYVSYLV